MNKSAFGTLASGQEASLYTISNSKGMSLAVTDYGVCIVSVFVKDKEGNTRDVVLGYDDVSGYEKNLCYFGATIGRNCNRISDAKLTIDGVTYEIENNDNGNNLHSGSHSLARVIWSVEEQTGSKIVFTYQSPDLEEGYPGNVTARVTVEVTEDNEFAISYYAVSDKKTVLNMTNHCYYNLNGHASGTVLDHTLWIHASHYTPVHNEKAIPTGEILPVQGTPFDFTEAKPIGRDINADNEQLRYGHGYDHNFVLDRTAEGMEHAGSAYSASSGIRMDVYTDCIAMQLYSANGIAGQIGKGETIYPDRSGFCLETQYCPNSVNEPNFATPIFDAGVPYESKTVYRFSVN
jgi:aldose 1-epimerase